MKANDCDGAGQPNKEGNNWFYREVLIPRKENKLHPLATRNPEAAHIAICNFMLHLCQRLRSYIQRRQLRGRTPARPSQPASKPNLNAVPKIKTTTHEMQSSVNIGRFQTENTQLVCSKQVPLHLTQRRFRTTICRSVSGVRRSRAV
jgi:hypothetical protein